MQRDEGIYSLALEGETEKSLVACSGCRIMRAVPGGFYYLKEATSSKRPSLYFFDLLAGSSIPVLLDLPIRSVEVSPDGQVLLFNREKQDPNVDLMLVENFR